MPNPSKRRVPGSRPIEMPATTDAPTRRLLSLVAETLSKRSWRPARRAKRSSPPPTPHHRLRVGGAARWPNRRRLLFHERDHPAADHGVIALDGLQSRDELDPRDCSRGNRSPRVGHHPESVIGLYRFTMGRRVARDCNAAVGISGLLLALKRVAYPQQTADVAAAFVGRGGGRGRRNSVGASADLPQGALCGMGFDCLSESLGVVVEVAAGGSPARRGRGCLAARRRRCRTRLPVRRVCGAACAPELLRAPRRPSPARHVDRLDLVLDAAARQPRAVVVDEQRGGLVLERVGVLNAA